MRVTPFGDIQRVAFQPLQSSCNHRRGTIAIFHLKRTGRVYVKRGVEVVQAIMALLSEEYGSDAIKNELGDQNGCLVWPDNRDHAVRIEHKVWSEQQLKAFRDIIFAIAPLYGWTITDYTA